MRRMTVSKPLRDRTITAPAARGQVLSGSSAVRNHMEVGDEYLMNLAIPSTAEAGQLLTLMNVQPALILNSRLRALASIYAQYRFSSLEFSVISALPSSTAGMLAVAVDKNITALPYTGGTANNALAYTMACTPNVETSLWNSFKIRANAKSSDSRQKYYLTDPTGVYEENTQYRLLLTMALPPGGLSSGPYTLLLKIKYVCEFSDPVNLGNALNTFAASGSWSANVTFPGMDSNGIIILGTLPTGAFGFSGATNSSVYAVNPNITAGILPGSRPVAAVVYNTNATSATPWILCYSSVADALACTSSVGNISGAGAAFTMPTDVSFIYCGECAVKPHA